MLVSVEVAFRALSLGARVTVWCVRAADHIVWPFDAGLGEIFGCLIPHILSTPVRRKSRM